MDRTKINILSFIILLVVFIMPSFDVGAAVNVEGHINGNDVLFSSIANVTTSGCLLGPREYYGAPGILHCLDSGEVVKVLNTDNLITSTISSCSLGYYQVSTQASNGNYYNGYVCADKITLSIDVNKYADEFAKANIPQSYWTKLAFLKILHPNWSFTGYKTGLDWTSVIKSESLVGLSYIENSNPIFLSLDAGSYNVSTNTYEVREGKTWYAANSSTVAYYMDPRNFLDEIGIFQFENLGYNPSYQTLDVINKIFENSALLPFAQYYIEAATYNGNNISPIMLAARSRLEVYNSPTSLSDSANGISTYRPGTYNFYNINALSSCPNPINCALDFASGFDGKFTSYSRPWNDPRTAILGGASWIGEGWINKKQNTIYFQKWDVVGYEGNFNHQYMTNIQAPYIEGKSTWASYKTIPGLFDSPLNFVIPVYENMPDVASALPTSVDQATIDKLKKEAAIETGSKAIAEIVNGAGYAYNVNYINKIGVGTTAQSLLANLKGTSSTTSITITTTNSNNVTTTISGVEKIGTGDVVTVSNGTTSETFRAVVNSDVNGDGEITAVDYVKVKNKIMGTGTLTGSYSLAADANEDGNISAVDYVTIKNKIMGS